MLNKKILIIILLTLHSAIALRSANFCHLKQKVCKGYYDKKQKYQTKCDLVECSDSDDKLTIKCGLDHICSSNKTECNKYKQLNSYFTNSKFIKKYSKIKMNFDAFNNNLRGCQKKIYKFDKNDFCLLGIICVKKQVSPTGLGYNYVKKKTDCKCPNVKGFKCGKYCTKDSNACDYLKLNKNNKTFIENIKTCDDGNVSFLRSFFQINFM
jgi:hypothetical protein